MAYISKKKKIILEMIDSTKLYLVDDAMELLKKVPRANFVESVDIDVALGIDTKKSDQVVRGAVVLPHGTGRKVVIAAFVEDQMEQVAKDAGADIVGLDVLVEEISKTQKVSFDIAIAHPSVMGKLGKIARVLGSKGLMPNPKNGTLSTDIKTAVENVKAGQVNYRADKFGIVHASIGRIDFENNCLKENLESLVISLKKSKPSTSKGMYLKKLSLSATMGASMRIDINSLTV